MTKRVWRIGDRTADLSKRGMIMGVLNVTPDSFSDGGLCFGTEQAVGRGVQIAAEGADIIDIGGESTRPGAEPIPLKEELRRVIPVIEKLRATIDILISIDTSKSEVANAALDAGASIVNDVTGGRGDEKMLPLAAKRGAAVVLMHMQGEPRTMQKNPQYGDVVREVADFFRQRYDRALECGVDPMAIAFDPGIGFGKTLQHNLQLLANLDRLRVEDRPIVLGVSRKYFVGKLIGDSDMGARLAPGVALTSLLRSRGAEVFRVHDVKQNVDALRVTEAILAH
jgi:dihydropteroate synthase